MKSIRRVIRQNHLVVILLTSMFIVVNILVYTCLLYTSHYGFSVNGVAYLHTEILKNSELNAFYPVSYTHLDVYKRQPSGRF